MLNPRIRTHRRDGDPGEKIGEIAHGYREPAAGLPRHLSLVPDDEAMRST